METPMPFYNMNESTFDNYSYDNGSYEEMCETSTAQKLCIKVAMMCILSAVFLLGFLGNLMVITTFALYRRLRLRCMTDIFLFHLAVCDMLLLFTIPLEASDIVLDGWKLGSILCKLTHGLYAVNTYSGLLLLACISVDRCVVIVHTHTAQRLRRKQLLYSKLAVLAVWLISLLLSLPEIIFVNVDNDSMCVLESTREVRMATRASHIAGFCLPFLIMLICYSLIGRTLLRGQGWRRQRTLRLILLLVLVFVVFQLPYTIVLSVKVASIAATCSQWNATLLAEYVTESLAYTRCSLNPLLYALVGVRFRRDVLNLLRDMGCPASTMTSLPDSCASITPTLPTSRSFFASTNLVSSPLLPVIPKHRNSPCSLSSVPPIDVKEFTTSPIYCANQHLSTS